MAGVREMWPTVRANCCREGDMLFSLRLAISVTKEQR